MTVLLQVFFWFWQWKICKLVNIWWSYKAYKNVPMFWATLSILCHTMCFWTDSKTTFGNWSNLLCCNHDCFAVMLIRPSQCKWTIIAISTVKPLLKSVNLSLFSGYFSCNTNATATKKLTQFVIILICSHIPRKLPQIWQKFKGSYVPDFIVIYRLRLPTSN